MTLTAKGAIVMGVYRPDPQLLARQIRSIAEQTMSNWQCTIAVDGSDAETTAEVKRMVGTDVRFTVLEHEVNVGAYRNYERLLAGVSGDAEWVAIADQDDYWYPRKLEVLCGSLASTGAPASVGRGMVKDMEGTAYGPTSRRPGDLIALILLNQVSGGLMVLRADVTRMALPFPERRARALPDHWLAVCAASAGPIDFNETVVQDYIQHAGNMIGESTLPPLIQTAVSSARDGAILRGLVVDTWSWRVAMATAVLERCPTAYLAELRSISKGRITIRLMKTLLHRVARRDTPARVALALFVGAAANTVKSRSAS
jgi:glycosyltransferase involved in cell wall biosynthesis